MSITTNLHLVNSVPMNDNNNSPLLNSNNIISASNVSYSNKVPIYNQSPIHNDVLGQLSSSRDDSIPSFIDASNAAEGSPPYLNASSPTGDVASFMDIAKLTETPSNISETSDNTTYASYIPPSPSYIPPRNNFDSTPVQNYNETTIENSLVSNDPYNENQRLLDDITSPTSSGGTLNSDNNSSNNRSLAQVKIHERLQIIIIRAQILNDAAEADVPDGEPHRQGDARSQSNKKREHTEMEGSLIFEKYLSLFNLSILYEDIMNINSLILYAYGYRAPSETLNQRLFTKKKRVREHFEDLESCYLSYRLQDNLFGSSSMVSSIEFDCDDEYFATKKIKIFEYGNIERQLVGASLGYNNNVSSSVRDNICLSWNTYKTQIASADYDGVVSLWDVNTGMQVMSFDEHEKRAWSVDFSRMDPTKLASDHHGDTRENQCSFIKAIIKRCLMLNSCDPISTDSTLRLWNTNTNSCVRTFTGYVNEKNFVDLIMTADWIMCGSEENSVIAYYKPCEEAPESDASLFVSSVCWKKNSNIVLANSQALSKC
ncbi:1395_t:CDS:2 [Ambispora leptoticha]|uniref:1395_t:CDS:1 n=1 Tax=Ambispora leptoticha TaxID=144679 RepID=A0A9N8ZX14_9GLOM|nr:1395_t:CDS:2 [Ambispora leptoticha]